MTAGALGKPMDMIRRAVAWGTAHEGSTRSAALLRIAFALIVWTRFADEVAFFRAIEPGYLLYGAWLLGWTALALIGLYTRVALAMVGLTVAIGYLAFGVVLDRPGWLHHHVYLLAVLGILLALTPCDRSYSVDRWREVRRAERAGEAPPAERGPLWGLRLIGLQLSAIYFWAAFDKTDAAWFSGERLEATLMWVHSGRPLEGFLLSPLFLVAASAVVVAVEYFLAVAIHVTRWQRFVLPAGLALHAAFYLFLPVATYSVTMVAMYLAVIRPDAVHRFIDRLHGHVPSAHRL